MLCLCDWEDGENRMNDQQCVVDVKDLTKAYDGFVAVNKLNLQIIEGEVFGFLGPNGAGKTTSILMLLGLTEPTSGTVRVCGCDPAREPIKVKKVVGYLPENVGFYDDLTARQNLDYTASLNNISAVEASNKIDELLKMVGLSDVSEQKVGEFSHGMKQRLGIADVMIKDPKIVFFDEPTTGIDPEGVDKVLNLISGMVKRKITIVLSSHQLHQVQKICTRIGIMDKGHLVVEGSIDSLGRDTIGEGKFQIEAQVTQRSDGLIESIKGIEGVLNVESSGDVLFISCNDDLRPQVAKTIVNSDSLLIQMKIEEYGLEEIYKRYFHGD